LKVSAVSIVIYISTCSALLPLGYVLYLRDWKVRISNFIFVLSVVSLLSDGISLVLASRRINNWPVGNSFLIIQFVILFLLLSDRSRSKVLTSVFLICVAFDFIDLTMLHTPRVFNSYAAYTNAILMIVLSLWFQYRLLKEMPVEKIQRFPFFWLSFGVLTYYGGTMFLFLFNNYLIEYFKQSHGLIWVLLHNLLNISKNIFLFLTVWTNSRNRVFQ
jgi:membrane-associated HD superfamily phosphohydrolase